MLEFKSHRPQPPQTLDDLIVQATRWMGSSSAHDTMVKTMVIRYRDQIQAHPDAKNNPRAQRVINACTAFIVR